MQPAPPPSTGVQALCQVCGRGPATEISARKVTGMIVLWAIVPKRGILCREHGLLLAKSCRNHTVLLGWWSFVTFFVNPLFVIEAVMAVRKANKLPPPAALAPPPAPPAPPSAKRAPRKTTAKKTSPKKTSARKKTATKKTTSTTRRPPAR